jgi:predicted small secreted protein
MRVALQDNIVVAIEAEQGVIDPTISHNKIVELTNYRYPIKIGWIYQNPEVPEGVDKSRFVYFFDNDPPPLPSTEPSVVVETI